MILMHFLYVEQALASMQSELPKPFIYQLKAEGDEVASYVYTCLRILCGLGRPASFETSLGLARRVRTPGSVWMRQTTFQGRQPNKPRANSTARPAQSRVCRLVI